MALAIAGLYVNPVFAVQLSPDAERIMEVLLSDGTELSAGLIAYHIEDRWYLPLTEISEAMGVAVKLGDPTQTASGFIIRESNRFYLDTRDCRVEYNGKNEKFDCSQSQWTATEIYVSKGLLESWYPLTFSIDPFKSTILIYPKEKLPLQERREREGKTAGMGMENARTDYPIEESDSPLLDGPFINQTFSGSREYTAGERSTPFSSKTQFSGQLGGLNTSSFLNIQESRFNRFYLNLSKKDPEARIFGVAHLREIQAVNVDFPALPLVGGGHESLGLMLSNYPLSASSSFSHQDFQGPLQTGWEVELYQNDILIGRQSPDESGRYHFKQIPIFYGKNQFQLRFYGPYGERVDEYRTFQIDPSILKQGETHYRLGMGSFENQLNPLFQAEKSLGSHLSAQAGFTSYALPEKNQTTHFVSTGLRGYTQGLLASADLGYSGQGGKILEGAIKLPIRSTSLGLTYDRLFDRFESDLFRLEYVPMIERIKADLSFVIPSTPSVGSTIEWRRDLFEEGIIRHTVRDRLATGVGPLFVSHLASVNFGNRETSTYTGTPIALVNLLGNSLFRVGSEYNLTGFTQSDLEYQHGFSDTLRANLQFRRIFSENVNSYRIQGTKVGQKIAMGIQSEITSKADYSFGIFLNSSFAFDRIEKKGYISGTAFSEQGAASLLVFLDVNRNGEWDEGEKFYPDIPIFMDERELDIKTDASGRAWIPRLTPFVPISFSIGSQHLNEPSAQSAKKGVRIYPRPGSTTEILFPIVYVGAIDGMISTGMDRLPLWARNVDVILENLTVKGDTPPQKVRSDRDGLFWFDGLSPGKYRVKISPEYLKGSNLSVSPLERVIDIGPNGGFFDGQNFFLRRN